MFLFYDPPGRFDEDRPAVHVGIVPSGLTDKHRLLDAVGRALAFPPYFGRNFDALWDCLTDLENIEPVEVALVHRDLPALPGDWTSVYLETLRDAVLFWERYPEHNFAVWFPGDCEKAVTELEVGLPPPMEE